MKRHCSNFGQTVLSTVLLLFLTVSTVAGQQYIVDPLFEDSVRCQEVTFKDTVWQDRDFHQYVMVPRGMLIDSCGRSASPGSIIFKYQGRHYRITKHELLWSKVNPPEMQNTLSKSTQLRHSALGHFFATMTPCYIVIALLLLSFVFSIIGTRFDVFVLRQVSLAATPLCLLLVAVIELLAYYCLGSDAFWWCDYDRHGFFGSLLRLIPFALVVAAQVLSIYWYENVLFFDSPYGQDQKIHLKPAVYSILGFIPVAIVYFLIVNALLGWRGNVANTIGILLSLGTLVTGIVITFKRNIQEMGVSQGVLISLFSLVYILGCIVAISALVAVLIKLIIQVLVVLLAFTILGGLGGKKIYKDSWGNKYEKDAFGNYRKI